MLLKQYDDFDSVGAIPKADCPKLARINFKKALRILQRFNNEIHFDVDEIIRN